MKMNKTEFRKSFCTSSDVLGEFLGVHKLCHHFKPFNTLYHRNKPLSLFVSCSKLDWGG